MSYEDSISPEFYELERKAIFERAWLHVGRVEQLPRNGSYFTKEHRRRQHVAHHRARPRRRGARVPQHLPAPRQQARVAGLPARRGRAASARQFVCKYHGWKYDLDGACTFVQQEGEFFDFDKADFGLVPVHCDVFAGFIFVNLDREPSQSLRDFLGPMLARDRGLPVRRDDRAVRLPRGVSRELEGLLGRLHGVLPRTRFCTSSQHPRHLRAVITRDGLTRRRTTRSRVRTDWSRTAGVAPCVGDAAGEREAVGHRDAQRVVRPVGHARSRRAAAGNQPRRLPSVGPRRRSSSSRTSPS